MFDSMRIRTKLAIALAIPLVALIAMSFVVVNEAATDADAAANRASAIDEQVELATASLGPGGVIDTIQNERNSEAIEVIGMSGATEGGADPAENRRLNDQAIVDFKAALATKPQAVQDAYAPAVAELDRVNDARAQADGYAGERGLNEQATVVAAQVFDQYSAVIDALFDANSRVALAVDDASLRNGARIIDLASRTEDVHTRLTREVIFDVVLGGVDTDEEIAKTVELYTQIESLDGDLRASATGPYVGIVDTVLGDQLLIDFRGVLQKGMAGESLDVAQLLGGEGTQGLAVITGLGAVRRHPARGATPPPSRPTPSSSRPTPRPSSASCSSSPASSSSPPPASASWPAARSPSRSPASPVRPRTWPTSASPTPCRPSSRAPSARTSSCPSWRRCRPAAATRSPRSPTPSTRCRPVPRTSRSSRPCCAATSRTRS